jgi:hypothetical protein
MVSWQEKSQEPKTTVIRLLFIFLAVFIHLKKTGERHVMRRLRE